MDLPEFDWPSSKLVGPPQELVESWTLLEQSNLFREGRIFGRERSKSEDVAEGDFSKVGPFYEERHVGVQGTGGDNLSVDFGVAKEGEVLERNSRDDVVETLAEGRDLGSGLDDEHVFELWKVEAGRRDMPLRLGRDLPRISLQLIVVTLPGAVRDRHESENPGDVK